MHRIHQNSNMPTLGTGGKYLFRWIAFLLCGTIVLASLSFWYFNKQVYLTVYQQNFNHVNQLAVYFTKNFQTKIQACFQVLKSTQILLEPQGNLLSDSVLQQLQKAQEDTGFSAIGVIDKNGNLRDTDNNSQVLTDLSFVQRVLSGKPYISDLFVDEKSESQNSIVMALPVYEDNAVIGILYGKHPVDPIIKQIEFDTGSGNYFQIIDSNGNYISHSSNENILNNGQISLWEELRQYQFNDGMTPEEIQAQVLAGSTGSYFCSIGQERRYVGFQPIGINQWYVFSSMPEQNVNSYASMMRNIAVHMLIQILLCLVIVMIVIILYARRVYQLIQDKTTTLEVHNRLFQLVLQKTKDIPFEVDLRRDEITLHGSLFPNGYLTMHLSDVTPSSLLEEKSLDPDSYDAYEGIYGNLMKAEIGSQAVVHITLTDQMNWFKIVLLDVYQLTFDTRVVGVLEYYEEQKQKDLEIELRKKQAQHLSKRSEHDFLTGLLNRAGFQKHIKQYLTEPADVLHAFVILDLDHFKEINDTFGHSKGDEVLRDVGNILSTHFRKDDIIARLGGDEFVILLKDLDNDTVIERLANSLNQSLEKTYTVGNTTLPISASIGIARAPIDGISFKELYEKADTALYHVKRNGKNGFCIFTSDLSKDRS